MIQGKLYDCVFYDFFAGSGGIGIEALSRGAKHSYFVENNNKALQCIQKNLAFTKLTDKGTVISRDVLGAIPFLQEKADIIFMDPPYQLAIEGAVCRMLKQSGCLKKDTLIIMEAPKERDFTDMEELGFTIIKEKIYKTNKHVFLQNKQS